MFVGLVYLAVLGQVWFLSQVVAACFFTLAMWAVLRSDRSCWWPVAAGTAFGASVLAHNSELFAGLFFPLVAPETGRRVRDHGAEGRIGATPPLVPPS